MFLTGVTLRGSCGFPAGAPLTVDDTTPARFQTISFSVNEKQKDSKRIDKTTSEEDSQVNDSLPV